MPNLLKNQPAVFGTYPEFLASCRDGTLPDYSFVEPNYTDHDGDSGEILASDQHPDHHVREGDRFIGSIYNAIRRNESLWRTTALLIVTTKSTAGCSITCRRPRARPAVTKPSWMKRAASRSSSIGWACGCRRCSSRHGCRGDRRAVNACVRARVDSGDETEFFIARLGRSAPRKTGGDVSRPALAVEPEKRRLSVRR